MTLRRRLQRRHGKIPRGMHECPDHGLTREFLVCRHLDEEGLYHREDIPKTRRRMPRALCRKCFEIGEHLDPEGLDRGCGVCIALLPLVGPPKQTTL